MGKYPLKSLSRKGTPRSTISLASESRTFFIFEVNTTVCLVRTEVILKALKGRYDCASDGIHISFPKKRGDTPTEIIEVSYKDYHFQFDRKALIRFLERR